MKHFLKCVHSHHLNDILCPMRTFLCSRQTEFWHCKLSSHDTQPIPRVQSCCWWSSLVPKMHHPNGRSYRKERILLLNCAFGGLFLHFQLIQITMFNICPSLRHVQLYFYLYIFLYLESLLIYLVHQVQGVLSICSITCPDVPIFLTGLPEKFIDQWIQS